MLTATMFVRALFLAFLVCTFGKKVSYTSYKVYNILPKTTEQLEALKHLHERIDYDFWTDPVKVDSDVRIMVSPAQMEEFEDYLKKYQIQSYVTIDDVQRIIDAQRIPSGESGTDRGSRGPFHNFGSMTWDRYYTLEDINAWLDELSTMFPGIVETVVMGYSNEGREQKGIIIDYHPEVSGQDKVIGMLEGGIHAREWISPATITWIIKEFLTSDDRAVRSMAESIQWHIFPVVNPDGYSHTFDSNRLWRKNRNYNHTTSCNVWGVSDDMSNGIDLNRNFDQWWMTVGASDNPCAETFAGWAGFSEPESRAIANYVLRLQGHGNLMYYIAFHSYSQMLLVPYSHTEGLTVLQADNYADMFEIGIRAMDKLTARHGTAYTTGTSAEILYATSGASFDWVKAQNVPIVYLYELRDVGEYGFLLPTDQIVPNGEEVTDSLAEMHRVAQQLGYYSVASSGAVVPSLIITVLFAALGLKMY